MAHRTAISVSALAGVVAGALGLASPASSQEWQPNDCRQAPLRLEGAVSCAKLHSVVGTGGIGLVEGDLFNVSGRGGDYAFAAVYFPPPPQTAHTMTGGWATYSTKESEGLIKQFAGGDATQFGPYRGFDQTGYVEYRVGSGHCVGFDHGGGANAAGYEFFVRGFICSRSPIASPERIVRELLAAVEVYRAGQSKPINAFGAAPVALSWR